jgi:hypothetical protein
MADSTSLKHAKKQGILSVWQSVRTKSVFKRRINTMVEYTDVEREIIEALGVELPIHSPQKTALLKEIVDHVWVNHGEYIRSELEAIVAEIGYPFFQLPEQEAVEFAYDTASTPKIPIESNCVGFMGLVDLSNERL